MNKSLATFLLGIGGFGCGSQVVTEGRSAAPLSEAQRDALDLSDNTDCALAAPDQPDSSASIQSCVNTTASGGTVLLRAGTYHLGGVVIINRGIHLVGNGLVVLKPLSHTAGLRFPDMPNRATVANIQENFTGLKGPINFLDYFKAKSPIRATKGGEFQTITWEGNGLFNVKRLNANEFEYYTWDQAAVYLRVDQSQHPNGYKLIGGNWMPLFPTLATKLQVNSTIVWYQADTCKKVNSASFPYTNRIISHTVTDFGGDVGFQDTLTFGYAHSGSCPGGRVEEIYEASSQWGHVRWSQICVKTQKVMLRTQPYFLDADPSHITLPNQGIACH